MKTILATFILPVLLVSAHPRNVFSISDLPSTLPAPGTPGCGSLGRPACPTSTTSAPVTVNTNECTAATRAACHFPPPEEHPPCKEATDCTNFCNSKLGNTPDGKKFGVGSVCMGTACSCTTAFSEIIVDGLIGIGEVVCLVADAAIPIAEQIVGTLVPYLGPAAQGAERLFTAAGKVLKQGAKNCADVCPGHQFTVVDPMDLASQLGILDCGLGGKRI